MNFNSISTKVHLSGYFPPLFMEIENLISLINFKSNEILNEIPWALLFHFVILHYDIFMAQ